MNAVLPQQPKQSTYIYELFNAISTKKVFESCTMYDL